MANTIADMLAMETAEPDKTLTPIEVFGEKSKDADDVFEKLSSIVGAIQSNPAYDEEGNLKYKGGYPGQGSFIDPFDLIPGLGAVGASIRGGKVYKSTFSQLNKLSGKYLNNVKSSRRFKDIADFEDYNKLSKARIQKQKVLDKHGIADPDKQGMVDPVSALLNYFSKN